MAEIEAPGGGGAGVPVDGGGARAMVGGSLPPRKRLLAGLKQNGLWPAASSQASPSTPRAGEGGEGGAAGGLNEAKLPSPTAAAAGAAVVSATTSDEEGSCTSCGAQESSAWRRVKANGVVQRLCNSCALSLNKNMNCPHCLAVCPEVQDPTLWLHCHRCQRYLHVECEKDLPSAQLDNGSYMCSECVHVKKHKEVLLANRPKGCVPSRANCSVEAGNCASSAAPGCSTPCVKKPRLSRDPRSRSTDPEVADGSTKPVARMCGDGNKGVANRKTVTSQEAVAAAAAAAAALATSAAKAAKATAAAKAATAVKAAAAAKAALDAAAEAQSRCELRRGLVFSEHNSGASRHDAKERSEKAEGEADGDKIRGPFPQSIDDEELARQLHRAINSSPRIARGLIPLRRKPTGKPGTVANASDSTRAWPRGGAPVAAMEPRLQPNKQQQTRPRSGSHKELKRLDSRVVKQESKRPGGYICPNSAQQVSCIMVPDTSEQLATSKSEPADFSMGTSVRPDSDAVQCQDMSNASQRVMTVKAETDENGAAASEVFLDIEDGQDGRFSASDASQAAAMLDEVLMSEANAEEAAQEEYLSRLRAGMPPRLKEEELAAYGIERAVASDHTGELEVGQEHHQIADRSIMVDGAMSTGVATLAGIASDAMEVFQDGAVAPGKSQGESQWALDNRADSLDGRAVDQANGAAPEFGNPPSQCMPELDTHVQQPWQEGTAKIPAHGVGCESGVHTTS